MTTITDMDRIRILLEDDKDGNYNFALRDMMLHHYELPHMRYQDYTDIEENPDYLIAQRFWDETQIILVKAFEDPYATDQISHLAMELSLCPMHFVDWAICFDDENPECEQIRQVFPHGHDT